VTIIAPTAALLAAIAMLVCASGHLPTAPVAGPVVVHARAASSPRPAVPVPSLTPPSPTRASTPTPVPTAPPAPVSPAPRRTPVPAPRHTSAPTAVPTPAPMGPIVALGDSITYGYGAGVTLAPYGPAPAGSYPWDMAGDLGVPVVNAGVSGTMAREVLDPATQPAITRPLALQLPALLALHPRLMVVGFGTNEALQGVTIEQASADLDQLLKRIAAAGVPLVIVGTHVDCVVAACPGSQQVYTGAWDAALSALAARYHAGLVLDVEHGLTAAAEMTDVVHPDAAGYVIVAQRVGAVVRSRLALA
jgi:lysophospholipase L1-like esterase